MLPHLLQSLPQRFQRAQAGKEAQCLRGGFKKVVFKQNGRAYTLFYEDVERPDGTTTTQRARHPIGDLSILSERAARREHDLFMAEVNRRRGSVPVTIEGETFRDAVDAWKKDVAPQLSPATVRQRESYLRTHGLPAFAKEALHARPGLTTIRYHATKQLVSEDGDQHLGNDLCSPALCEKVRDQDESGFFFGPDDPEPGKSRASVLHS